MTPLALQASLHSDPSVAIVDEKHIEQFSRQVTTLSTVHAIHPQSLTSLSQFIKYFLCRTSIDFGYCTSVLTRKVNPATYFRGRYARDGSDFLQAWGLNPGSEGLEYVVNSEILDNYFETARLPQYYEVLKELLAQDAKPLDYLSNTLSHLIAGQGELCDIHAQLVCQAFPLSYSDPFARKAILALNWAVRCFNQQSGQKPITISTSFPVDSQVFFVMHALRLVRLPSHFNESVGKERMLREDDPRELAIRAACFQAGELFAKATGMKAFDAYLFLSGQIGLCRQFVRYCPTLRY